MDLNQRKLNKNEWDSIEVPVSQEELAVLNLIVSGYDDVNISVNNNKSLLTFLKIEYNEKMEDFLYNKYFATRIDAIIKSYKAKYLHADVDPKITIRSADKIRLERNDEERLMANDIYEFVLISHMEAVIRYNDKDEKLFSFHYYSLHKLIRNSVLRVNRHIVSMANTVLSKFSENVRISTIVEQAVDVIERNGSLLKYNDMVLYDHQKEILTICKADNPKLVLYIAPTGTGKTLTPLALSQKHKIIFVCAARHVGLALARAAISVHKKVAFAFGCSSAADIRLHYFAAKVYTKNKRTGGIGKVDNSEGSEVEIMICDIKSYLPAMYYMKAFSTRIVLDENGLEYEVEDINNLITYWDEPTITMDYLEHDFHKIIRNNWKGNLIPNVVLSSATLPKQHEITETIANFSQRFFGSRIHSVVSHDCKKSIPIINKDGFVVLPHYLCDSYEESQQLVRHCEEHLTLLRYFDLDEVVKFITFVTKNSFIHPRFQFDRYFEQLSDVNMKSIKMYYLTVLRNIEPGAFEIINKHFKETRVPRIKSNMYTDSKGNKISSKKKPVSSNPGIYVTTCDAFTLTDGPTIFITDDVEKIAKFYIQQANIPACVMDDLMSKIEHNNVLNRQLGEIENNLDEISEKFEEGVMNAISSGGSNGVKGRNKSSKDIKMFNREESTDGSRNKKDNKDTSKSDAAKLKSEAETLRSMIKSATLNDTFVPNKFLHLAKWADGMLTSSVFTSNIEESIVSEIMALDEVDDLWKVLLMMGIGVFTNHKNIKYTEIMKKLADAQKLFMTIATSDYIYGTNYQFCHGYLSKDLNLTQEKIIQALGRVGRNNIQQDYTLRFRDDAQIMKLFTNETEKPEIRNMNILFNSNKVVWDGENYVPAPEDEDDVQDEEEEEEEEEDA